MVANHPNGMLGYSLRMQLNRLINNFCSVQCRVEFSSTWPSDVEVANMFTNMSISEVADSFGKSYNAAKKKRAILKKKGLVG